MSFFDPIFSFQKVVGPAAVPDILEVQVSKFSTYNRPTVVNDVVHLV